MDVVLRAILAYVFILFLMRVVGRRELSSMEPSDVILLVVIGDLIQSGVTQNDESVTGIVLAAGTIGLLATVTAFLTFRSRRIHNLIEGEPVILVQDGKTIDRNLRNERLTLEELMEQARLQQIESLDSIKWAVLETNGAISFIEKK
ncbi:MAG TPA: YetF domain-containing protein [Gaiellaceae bacterium]|jgi:uncharacterized membrane protein YcaP (DUF421 family)